MVEQNEDVGIWEPFLFYNNLTQRLEVYYAKERSNGTQAIVKKYSQPAFFFTLASTVSPLVQPIEFRALLHPPCSQLLVE